MVARGRGTRKTCVQRNGRTRGRRTLATDAHAIMQLYRNFISQPVEVHERTRTTYFAIST